MNEKNYFIGLDMGTESIGWAVTDEEYNLDKVRGQFLWGTFLFDKAESKKTRRIARSARRRLARVRQRLNILQSLFAEEIAKVDPTFFIRLNESNLVLEDKSISCRTKNVLFNDKNYTDKDFHREYKTIFHLRNTLMNGNAGDIRHLYIAIHHIIKNRGHFLFEGQTFEAGDETIAKNAFYSINAYFEDNDFLAFSLEKLSDALNVLKDKRTSKKDKKKKICEILCVNKDDKHLDACVTLMTGGGGKSVLKNLFNLEDECEFDLSFSKINFDEKRGEIENIVGADQMLLLDEIKKVYDWAVLCDMLNGEKSISLAKIDAYEKHADDLKRLKEYVMDNCPEEYKNVFRYKEKVANYAAYIGKSRGVSCQSVTKEDFYKYLKNTLKVTDESILKDIENGEFMPKQISGDNSVIPYQLHLNELEKILSVAEQKYEFLREVQDGVTVSQKIKMLMTFRVPYYVGPLGGGVHSWAVRYEGKEREKVTPWNFASVVDTDKTEDRFIERMTSKCTYLKTEDVLPKNSLLYSEYAFLNELNNLRINGEKNEQARRVVYSKAMQTGIKSISKKKIKEWLVLEGVISKTDSDIEISGVDDKLNNNLSVFATFRNIFGDNFEQERDTCEEIIKLITVVTDKDRLYKRLKAKFSSKLTEEQFKKIKGLNYTDWGRLSQKFLAGLPSAVFVDETTGECQTIIQVMRDEPLNLMEVLSNGNGFNEAVEEFNAENSLSEKVTYKTIEDLYCSPLVKRSIWRAISLVREIEKIKGKPPKKIFIEMARGEDEDKKGKRTLSRKEQLLLLYKNIQKEIPTLANECSEWIQDIEKLDDRVLSSKNVYLYYRQMGRCMYSGERIPFEQLLNKNIYDIDHIYPQSKIKDDSIENNLVLVKKQINLGKSDVYPLSYEIRNKMYGFWNELYRNGLISQEKFKRLTRSTPLTNDELADFVNRQIVITRQSTKEVANLFKQMYPETEIVYSKAGLVSDIKNQYKLVKCREVNDLHHAKDAYMNIVVGNVYNVLFQHDAKSFYKKVNDDFNISKLFDRDIKGSWSKDYIERVKNTYKIDRMRVVRFVKQFNGKFFDATIYHDRIKPENNDKLIPLKGSGKMADVRKYGGYDAVKGAYFVLAKSQDKKGKTLLSFEHIPVYWIKCYGEDSQAIDRYLSEKCGLINPQVVVNKIRIGTLIEIDGSKAYLAGRSDNTVIVCNANQLFLDYDTMKYLKRIESYMNKNKGKQDEEWYEISEQFDKITAQGNLKLYDLLTEKLSSPIYKALPMSGQVKVLIKARDNFVKLGLDNKLKEQCKVIMQILALLKCDARAMDLSLLGEGRTLGKNRINKFVQDKNLKIISQSPTGYYRKVIDIKEFL